MNKIIISLLFTAFLISGKLQAQVQLFDLDGGHSYIEFSVGYLGMMKQKGEFKDFDAAIVFDPSNEFNTSVTLNISANSINTNHNFRDKHLRSPDFLDVVSYPSIRFESKEVIKDNNQLKISGLLTLHGTTKLIEVPFQTTDLVTDWEGRHRVGFTGSVSINRKDFGVLGGNEFNPRFVKDRVIADSVIISFSIQGVISNNTSWQPAVEVVNNIRKDDFRNLYTEFKNKLQSDDNDEVLNQIIILYTATNSLIYDEEHSNKAIEILHLLEKSPSLDDRTTHGVFKKLAICYWLEDDNTKADIYLSKIESMEPKSPFVSEMRKLL